MTSEKGSGADINLIMEGVDVVVQLCLLPCHKNLITTFRFESTLNRLKNFDIFCFNGGEHFITRHVWSRVCFDINTAFIANIRYNNLLMIARPCVFDPSN